MSAGESPEPPRPAEVRVPITALPAPRRPAEPEDAGTGSGSGSGSSSGSPGREAPAELGSEEEEQVPYPALAPTAFFCLKQTTRPRSWCLRLVCNPYPFPRDTPRDTPGTPRHRRVPPGGRSIPAELRAPAAGSARGCPGAGGASSVCPDPGGDRGTRGGCGSGTRKESVPGVPSACPPPWGHSKVPQRLRASVRDGQDGTARGGGVRNRGPPKFPSGKKKKSLNSTRGSPGWGIIGIPKATLILLECRGGSSPSAVYIRAASARELSRRGKMELELLWERNIPQKSPPLLFCCNLRGGKGTANP